MAPAEEVMAPASGKAETVSGAAAEAVGKAAAWAVGDSGNRGVLRWAGEGTGRRGTEKRWGRPGAH
ncbi:hypothetical protein E2562_019591 [Oryza meyeriana var. granulata]|uniref:Uncharacterized protein n=1 Tax=Oryza meyeriana var. granulata TaxID=110450 RepID=A0A6G1EXF7_9ORYZ|nr:hypothetical protein E2562_019591 [Oryza meyeriana var. granulata]